MVSRTAPHLYVYCSYSWTIYSLFIDMLLTPCPIDHPSTLPSPPLRDHFAFIPLLSLYSLRPPVPSPFPLPFPFPCVRSSYPQLLLLKVKSKGADLTSDFWRDLVPSILPLQRAVSGLHYHGSPKLLVGALEVLTQLGADPNAGDKMGNTAMHKAVTVCTSRSVYCTSCIHALAM